MKKNTLFFFLIILLGVASDLLSKYVFYTLGWGKELFFLHPVLNVGIAWSLPIPWRLSSGVGMVIAGVLVRNYFKKKVNLWVASIVIAGILGNMIDRIVLNGVRDFINIGIFNFPIFNIADILLVVGIGLLIVEEFFTGKSKNKQ